MSTARRQHLIGATVNQNAAPAAIMQTDQVYVSSIGTTQLVISSTNHLPASSKLYVQCM
jgi:hypothetical protein